MGHFPRDYSLFREIIAAEATKHFDALCDGIQFKMTRGDVAERVGSRPGDRTKLF